MYIPHCGFIVACTATRVDLFWRKYGIYAHSSALRNKYDIIMCSCINDSRSLLMLYKEVCSPLWRTLLHFVMVRDETFYSKQTLHSFVPQYFPHSNSILSYQKHTQCRLIITMTSDVNTFIALLFPELKVTPAPTSIGSNALQV